MFGDNSRIPIRSTAVACAVLRAQGDTHEVLVLCRTLPPLEGVWYLVTGHVDEGESGSQAAWREVEEETGLTPKSLYAANFVDQWYNTAENVIELVPVFVAYVDDGADVDLNHEHSECKWVGVEDAIAHIAFHGHKDALKRIKESFIEGAPEDWRQAEV